MVISIGIPTMPERVDLLVGLLDDLDRIPWAKTVIVSQHQDSRLDTVNCVTRTEAAGDDWLLYLEDDVMLGSGFATIPEILSDVPAVVGGVSFFSLRSLSPGLHAVSASGWLMAQCVALRCPVAAGFRTFAASWYFLHPQHFHAADMLLGAWLAARGQRMMVYSPSLVQHRDVKSTLGGRSRLRQSPTFLP